jgi:effector-binding domain-containing protein
MQPQIVERAEQPYVAIRSTVTMQTINEIADRIPELFGWLAARGVAPTGAPFLKYNVIDMRRRLEIEAGIPVPADVEGDGDVLSRVLPAGRYVTVTHVGPFDKLLDVTTALLTWAETHDLDWDMTETPAGQAWGCRLEVYKTNPAEQPDVGKWETEIAFKLR